MPKEFITKQQAGHIKDKARKEKQAILGKPVKALPKADKERIKELNNIIEDADAVIRGDGRKKGR